MDGDQYIWRNIFVLEGEGSKSKKKKERKEKGIRKGIVPGLQVCVCREGRRALCIKSFHCRLATPVHSTSLPGCCVPMPTGSVLCPFLFSPPSAIANSPSISHPGVEFQHRVENKRERNPNPTCNSMRRDRTQLCLMPISVLWPLPSGALGGTGWCWGQGEDGECRAVGSSFLVWLGLLAAQSPPTPLFQITKLPDPTEPPQIRGKSRQLF